MSSILFVRSPKDRIEWTPPYYSLHVLMASQSSELFEYFSDVLYILRPFEDRITKTRVNHPNMISIRSTWLYPAHRIQPSWIYRHTTGIPEIQMRLCLGETLHILFLLKPTGFQDHHGLFLFFRLKPRRILHLGAADRQGISRWHQSCPSCTYFCLH